MLVGVRRLELPVGESATPRARAVMGDSGCRGEIERKPQPCTGDGFTKVWPFGIIAEDEKLSAADLIIHVGDYNYRNTPRSMVLAPRATGYPRPISVKGLRHRRPSTTRTTCPRTRSVRSTGARIMQGSPIPDVWSAWRDHSSCPATRLMKSAWLLVRGNHELCSRAGPGWFYLLDPGSSPLGGARNQEHCPPQTPAGWQPGAWPTAQPFDGQPFPVRITAAHAAEVL